MIDIELENKMKINDENNSFLLEELKHKMTKLQVIDNNSGLYLLRDEYGNLRKKTIILINKEIKINDYIYLSDKTIKEENIFTYGEIYNITQINTNEILIIESKDNLIALQRYYG